MNDFAHQLALNQIHDGQRLDLSAHEDERHAIVDRLGLAGMERFDAHVVLDRDGDKVRATGRIRAVLTQQCVASGEPVPAHVDEAFELLFMPEPQVGADEELELSEGDCDVVFHDGATLDLGAALADTLALALDPYPRSPAAADALREAGVLTEEQVSPFAALAQLKGLAKE